MLKYSLYDCPCQNSCWKSFLSYKTFYPQYGDPDADYDLCVAEVTANIQPLHLSKLHLCKCYWKDPVSGSISIDNFLLNPPIKLERIISLHQYTML